MASARRTAPLPVDFEYALTANGIVPDLLKPYLVTPPPPWSDVTAVEPALPTDEPDVSALPPFLGPQLTGIPAVSEQGSGQGQDSSSTSTHPLPYIPRHLPAFPSRHTYRATPVYAHRETDPRRVRERATEQGRLGEEALRKLARAAAARDAAMQREIQEGSKSRNGGHGEDSGGRIEQRHVWGRRVENMEGMFDKTMRALVRKEKEKEKEKQRTNGEGAGGSRDELSGSLLPSVARGALELGPIVNCERAYWRKREFRKSGAPRQPLGA